jgi:hypothetical protein
MYRRIRPARQRLPARKLRNQLETLLQVQLGSVVGTLLSLLVNDKRAARDASLSAAQKKRPMIFRHGSISYAHEVKSSLKTSITDGGYQEARVL